MKTKMYKLLILFCFILSGCTFGTPVYTKFNKNGAFLLTQQLNKDILCVEVETKTKNKKEMRCHYVSDSFGK